jgi:serine/threonine-protein kinase
MEYLDGSDLSGWVHQRGALPIETTAELVLQACEAIAEAHSLGIVHRDLKPANLFCIRRPDGELAVKVLDFGISKSTSLSGSGPDMDMTKTTAMMGSPLYMSPEQMQSAKNVDARTDIWALGVILYELLTGQVPFGGEALPELVLNVVSSQPRAMRDLRPDLPAGLEAVVLRCLEKNREQRYRNIAELAVALAPFAPKRARRSVERVSQIIQAAGLSVGALAAPPSSGDQGPVDGHTQASWGETKPPRGGRSAAIGLGVLGVTAMLGVVAVIVGRGRPSEGSPTATAIATATATLTATATPIATATSTAIASATPTDAAAGAPPQASAASTHAPSAGAKAKGSAAKPTAIAAPGAAAPAAPVPSAIPKYNPLEHL